MKRTASFILAIVMLFSTLLCGTALAAQQKMAQSSTKSTTGVELQYPAEGDYFQDPVLATAKASQRGGRIYLMPKPQAGNGNLGLVDDGTEVIILAESRGFYFFDAGDGRVGWNGKKYFSLTEISTGAYSSVSTTGVALEMPKASEYYGEEILASAKPENRGGFIYIMPKPKAGNGNLGTVDEGTVVTILAQRGSYYFFETDDGRMGWNGKKYFSFD